MAGFLSALTFLTLIPVPGNRVEIDSRMTIYFPLVGLVIGGILLCVDYAAGLVFGKEVRAAFDVLVLAVTSGGLHLDGLADTADGVFSHRKREEVLQIMRDPRTGVMGVLAVFFVMQIKWVALMDLGWQGHWMIFLVVPAMARSSLVMGLVFMRNARGKDSLGSGLFQKGRYGNLGLCWIPFLVPFCFDVRGGMILLTGFAILLVVLLWFFKKRLGGMTGDTLGASSEIIESALFLIVGATSV